MAWLALWLALVVGLMVSVAVVAVVVVLAVHMPLVFVPVAVLVYTVAIAGLAYLVNLPFMVLAFKSTFYRDRFRAMYWLDRVRLDVPGAGARSPFAVPASTEPTAKPVEAGDVIGGWQFYVDELARTIRVELSADGTFAQSIVTNRGDLTACPGGTWRLEGPLLHLSGYVTARDGTVTNCTWHLIDTPTGLALYGGDGPAATSSFFITRRPLETPVARLQ